jgi:hypothetical protein
MTAAKAMILGFPKVPKERAEADIASLPEFTLLLPISRNKRRIQNETKEILDSGPGAGPFAGPLAAYGPPN